MGRNMRKGAPTRFMCILMKPGSHYKMELQKMQREGSTLLMKQQCGYDVIFMTQESGYQKKLYQPCSTNTCKLVQTLLKSMVGAELGLAMCKQLVEPMGGQLTVSSREHYGSIFSFVLPYKISAMRDSSNDIGQLSEMIEHDAANNMNDDEKDSGFFKFQPRTCN